MDFSNNPAPVAPNRAPEHPVLGNRGGLSNRSNKVGRREGIFKWIPVVAASIVALLVIAVILVISFTSTKSQSQYVYSNKLQAVFLNTGQVYFGNIKSINQQYLVLDNIFYLQSNNSSSSASTSSSANNVSLVKLGCELHAPYDQMVINMQQVTFWENLKSTGQVAKAVSTYYQKNPNGQTCSNSSSTNSSSVGSTPSSTSSSTTSSTSSSAKKP